MNRNVMAVAFAMAGMLVLSGCPAGGYGRAWYNVYGDQCSQGPRPGCNFYKNGGVLDKISLEQDPYYDSDYTGLDFYIGKYYRDSFGNGHYFTGFGWESPNGILYDSFGSALNNASTTEASPDVVADVAAAEDATIERTGQVFAERHALAEDVGVKIARSLNHWANIGKTRERTEADVAYVSKQLFPTISMKAAEKAWKKLEAGDKSGADALSIDVSTSWGTTPEKTQDILKSWYSAQ